jgi:ATP-dependent Zn protease
MPQFRRLLAVIGMLILTGKSVQTIHKVIQSFLFKAKSSTPPLLLFSTFLKDLQNQKVQKVLLATDYFLVHAKGAIAPYRVLIPSRTESTYLVNTLVRAGVEFGALQPRAIRRILPFLITMVPFM